MARQIDVTELILRDAHQSLMAMASLQEYALVSQTEPRIEIFRKRAEGDIYFSH